MPQWELTCASSEVAIDYTQIRPAAMRSQHHPVLDGARRSPHEGSAISLARRWQPCDPLRQVRQHTDLYGFA